MTRIWNKLFLIFLFTSSLSLEGCWDFQDVNRRTSTLGVGVYYQGSEVAYCGENARFVPSSNTREGTQVSDIYFFKSVKGKDFEEARLDYTSKIPFIDFLGATRAVVFSREFAENGIESYTNRVNRLFGYRKSLILAVSREAPEILLRENVANNISVSFSIESTLDHLRNEGSALYSRLSDTLSAIALGNVGYLLPYITKENDTVVLLGYVVMKDSRLIDTIDLKDSDGLVYILSDNPQNIKAFSHPSNKDNKISIRSVLKKRSIKTGYVNNKVTIDLRLKIYSQLQYLYSLQPVSADDKKEIEDMLSNNIKESVTSVIAKSQKEYKSDIFNFAKHFRADNPKIYKQIKWKDVYPSANINVDVKVLLENLNLLDPNADKKY